MVDRDGAALPQVGSLFGLLLFTNMESSWPCLSDAQCQGLVGVGLLHRFLCTKLGKREYRQ